MDTTLGISSPNQGNIYVAYTAYLNNAALTADTRNTDVFILKSSDNGGTWTRVKVNDDSNAAGQPNDNFSSGNRTQFMPNVAVDPVTGAVVVLLRHALRRVVDACAANFITYSLDGGNTFSTQTYLNQSKLATDEVTGQSITIEPVPGNQGSAGALGFGDEQGLAVYGGHVYPAVCEQFERRRVEHLHRDGDYFDGPAHY